MGSIRTPKNQTIAMAGILQATFLCKNLATFGRADVDMLSASLDSILRLDTPDVESVYGKIGNLSKGLRLIPSQFGLSTADRDLDLHRYSLALIQLGNNVMSQDDTMDQLQADIVKTKALDFNILDETMVNSLANVYRNSISHLSPRIMVSGQPEYLNNEQIAAKIRASLLSGLRSVVLWRQCGGTKPGLLLSRTRYVRMAEGLLRGSV